METKHHRWNLNVKPEAMGLCWEGPELRLIAGMDAEWEGSVPGKEWIFQERIQTEVPGAKGEASSQLVSDRFTCGPLECIREIKYREADASAIELRLIARNIGEAVVRLHRLTPLVIHDHQHLWLGNHDVADWVFYRSGRQKNDLPSVCVLGRNDGAYYGRACRLERDGQIFRIDG